MDPIFTSSASKVLPLARSELRKLKRRDEVRNLFNALPIELQSDYRIPAPRKKEVLKVVRGLKVDPTLCGSLKALLDGDSSVLLTIEQRASELLRFHDDVDDSAVLKAFMDAVRVNLIPAKRDAIGALGVMSREQFAQSEMLRKIGERIDTDVRTKGIDHWQPDWQPPSGPVTVGNVCEGIPKPEMLAEGAFFPREEAMRKIYEEAEQWIGETGAVAGTERRVPILWLRGNSGAGKSVALLQVAAYVSRMFPGPVLWSGNRRSKLKSAVEAMSDHFVSGERALLVVDEPYSVVDDDDWKEYLEGIADSQGMIVCCGPREQADWIKRRYPDLVEITPVDLSNLTEDELAELQEWYRARTGSDALAPATRQPLMVCAMFELTHGGIVIEIFASKFRRELEQHPRCPRELEEVFTDALALNALGVDYPYNQSDKTLSAGVRDYMNKLIGEKQFAFITENSCLRLFHREIAKIIYSNWISEDAGVARAEHFQRGAKKYREAFSDSTTCAAPLWALTGKSTAAYFNVTEALKQIYQETLWENTGQLPRTMIAVWLRLASEHGDLELEDDLVSAAVVTLEDPGLNAMVAHDILRELLRPGYRRKQLNRVTECLDETLASRLELSGWGALMSAAIESSLRPKQLDAIIEWCQDHSGHALCPRLLIAVTVHLEDREVSDRLNADAIERFAASTVNWLKRHPSHPMWPMVYTGSRKVPLGFPSLAIVGRTWLQDADTDMEHPSWQYVWKSFTDRADDERLVRVGVNWLQGVDPNHQSWGFMWEELWNAGAVSREELTVAAQKWLARVAPEHQSWQEVWSSVPESAKTPVFRGIAEKWLENIPPDHLGLQGRTPAQVWQELIKAEDNPKLVEWSHRFLMGVDVCARDDVSDDDKQIIDWWLRVFANQPEEKLTDEIIGRAEQCLEKHQIPRNGWSMAWKRLLGYRDEKPVLTVGREWLKKTPPDKARWPQVWERLPPDNTDDDISRQTVIFLKDHPAPSPRGFRARGFIWLQLCRKSQDIDLATQAKTGARRWLEDASKGEPAWAPVWIELAKAGADPALHELGEQWLGEEHKTPQWWRVLTSMPAFNSRTDLATLAAGWLRCADPNNNAWQEIEEGLGNGTIHGPLADAIKPIVVAHTPPPTQ